MEEKSTQSIYPKDCERVSMFCQNAIRILEDLDIENNEEDIEWWLQEYEQLFYSLTNQPPGLAAIPRTTCSSVRYPVLNEFWRKYHRLKFPENYPSDDDLEDE